MNVNDRERFRVLWIPLAGTPDFLSSCGTFRAVYHATDRSGFPCYCVFFQDVPKSKRTLRNAIAVGGLPSYLDDTRR